MPERRTEDAARKATKPSLLGWLFLGIIKFYQLFISPLLGPNCRFQPTCSAYAVEAIHRHGAMRGGALAIRRILKCHPWGGFGYDPVPQSARDSADDGPDGPDCCGKKKKSEAAKSGLPHDEGMTSHG